MSSKDRILIYTPVNPCEGEINCCGALTCKNSSASNPNVAFYKFPKDPLLAVMWLKLTCNPQLEGESTDKLEDIKICSDHFDHGQFINYSQKKLKWNAVPTILCRSRDGKGTTEASAKEGSDEKSQDMGGNNFASCLERELVNPHKLTLRDLRGDSSDFSKLIEFIYDVEEEKTSPNHDLRTLFWELQHSNLIQLSAKNLKLYTELQSKQTAVYKLLQKCRRQYKSIEGISDICNSRRAHTLERYLSPSAAFLFAEQFSSTDQSETAHYWTTDEKIKGLSINKDSPKLYIILEKILALPPRRELRNLLKSFDITTGINNVMFHSLASRMKKIKRPKDKFCFLLFDEFPLEPGLHHQQGPDKIIGFEDLGIHGQSKMPVNFALVFMLRGLRKNWHQPVAYYFCHKATPTIILRRILAEVIESVHEVGLKILAIICDQAAQNTTALQSYISVEGKGLYVSVGSNEIATIYDPPSLLKLFRDSFRTHNIHWQGKVAKWSHIETLYEREKEEEYKLAGKLTKNHLEPKGTMRDRVDLAAEVLSYKVAAAIYTYSSSDSPGRTPLPWEAMSTPKVVATIDSLYDSFNRELETPKERSKMYSLFSETSNHLCFWSEALELIDEWKFIEPQTNKVVRPAAQDGWLNNIKACLLLRETLLKANIKQLSLRRLNLDPMRKLFSGLKHSGRNPSCSQFVSDLKTFLLNEKIFTSGSKLDREDTEDRLLADIRLHCNIEGRGEAVQQQEKEFIDIPEIDTLWAWEEPQLAYFEAQSVVWVGAFLAKVATEKFSCETCKSCLVSDEDSLEHFVIGEQVLHLLNPKDELCWLVSSMTQFCNRVLPNIVYENGVVAKLTKVSSERLNVQWLKVCSHGDKMSRFLLNVLSRINVHQFCKKYNRRFKCNK